MRDVRFEKYSVYGNNFILVDETNQPALREQQIAWLAGLVKDPVMGMACEGLILLQKNSKAALEQIYGRTDLLPEQLNHWLKAEYLFRYYEEECLEGLSCGNALLSLGAYLRREHRIPEAAILIEIPSGSPAVCSISTPDNDGFTLFDAGRPGPVGPAIFQGATALTDSGLQRLEKYRLDFSGQVDLPAEVATEVQLSGYFAAVGEPHLVFFYDDGTPVRKALFDLLLDEPRPATTPADQLRREQGDRLFHRIGTALNADPRFPIGINVNAVRVTGGTTLLYRTFERQGINRETCACGTGALASAHIARRLNLIDTPPGDYLRILPRKINMLRPPGDYFYQARYTDDERWQLKAKPSLVCKGIISVPG